MKAFSKYVMRAPWWLYIALVFVLAIGVNHFQLWDGLISLSIFQGVVVALLFTHITIAGVTIYLHRSQAHSAVALHPVVNHFFRFWMWLTTGMVTKEWVAIHRKHHARVETKDDPHSPKVYGLARVLFTGVLLYVRESHNKETMVRYGDGTPDDWLEHHLYTPYQKFGVVFMLFINFILFGPIVGIFVIWLTQMWWIPFLAAGVINGVGHYYGYRNYKSTKSPTSKEKEEAKTLGREVIAEEDASTNIVPIGILIGGEELHNNHHNFPTSARLSSKWYEFDIGWMYIRIMETLGLATVRDAYGLMKVRETNGSPRKHYRDT